MFGLEGRDTFNKPRTRIYIFFSTLQHKWQKIFPWVLVGLFIICMSIVGYVWYMFAYSRELTQQEKDVYVSQEQQKVMFEQERFDAVKATTQKRTEVFAQERQEFYDIFYN